MSRTINCSFSFSWLESTGGSHSSCSLTWCEGTNPQPEGPAYYCSPDLYSSIFPVWLTLTGVKDSDRHSSTGHRDTQATQSQQGGDPDEMGKELDFKCPLTTQKFEFGPQNEDFMSNIYFHFTWNQQPSHFETSFEMLLFVTFWKQILFPFLSPSLYNLHTAYNINTTWFHFQSSCRFFFPQPVTTTTQLHSFFNNLHKF